MPGRPRNADRQAIEAFARIHQGRTGSPTPTGRRPAGRVESGTFNGSGYGPDPGGGATTNGAHPHGSDQVPISYLPPLPNLERPRIGRRVMVASVATVVVVLIALGITGATSGHGRPNHLTASSTGSSAASGRTSSGTASTSRSPHRSGRAASNGRSAGSGGRSGHGASSSSTTVATGPISPSTTSAGSAQYQLASGSAPFTVTIEAVSGSCWAEAAPTSGGRVSWEGTLPRGAQQVLSAESTWWLRLGAPEYVTVTVNGRRLQLPPTNAPLDVGISAA